MKPVLKLTPSRVRDYLVCPRRFEQQYMVPPESKAPTSRKRTENAVMSLGSSLHSVLDVLHKPNQSSPSIQAVISDEEVEKLLSRHWRPEGYADAQEEDVAFQKAQSILKYYRRSKHVPQGQVLATEAYLSCLTTVKGNTVELSCRADRIELHDDGTLEIIDYKVSSSGDVPSASTLAQDLPTFLYFLLAWHYYRADDRVHNVQFSLLNLITLTKVVVQYDQRQLVLHREALRKIVLSALSGPLEPHVNASCAWCPAHEGCPAWVALDMSDLDNFQAWTHRVK
jgi:RecB family exonuclease